MNCAACKKPLSSSIPATCRLLLALVALLGLACSDGPGSQRPDAAVPDATTSDAGNHPDASLSLDASVAADATIALDASTPDSGPVDLAFYNFEAGAQGWSPSAQATSASATPARAFAGSQSLEIQVSGQGQAGAQVANPPVPAGATVTYHVWMPASSSLTGVQAFVQESAAPWRWTADWHAAASLPAGWNTFAVTVPSDATALQSLGVQFDIGAPWTGAVYVDSVSWTGAAPPQDAGIADAGAKPDSGVIAGDAGLPADAGANLGDAGPGLVIMPLGDSITGEPHTYRETLYGLLTTAGCAVHFVGSQYDQYATIPEKNHEGHPGWTIGNIAGSVDGWLLSTPPRYVLLMIGTNDVAWWCAQTGAQVADAHAALVDQILADAPGAWGIVASISPWTSTRR